MAESQKEQCMQVELLKQNVEYKDKKGEDRKGVNLFIKFEQTLIPIEVKYFADKITGVDSQFSKRKFLLSSVASELPKK